MQVKTFFSILFFLSAAAGLSAQFGTNAGRTVVVESEKMMSFGSRPGFRVEFPDAAVSLVESQWKDFAKQHYGAKLKKDKKSGEWAATALKSNMMGSEEFSIYSKVEKSGTGSALHVWYDLGSSFLSSRTNQALASENSRALRQFYFDVRRSTYDQQVKEQEDKLKEMERNNKNLEKQTQALYKDIETYKAKIKKAEEDIARNSKEQENGILNMEAQRRLIEETKQRKQNVENEGN